MKKNAEKSAKIVDYIATIEYNIRELTTKSDLRSSHYPVFFRK